MLRDTDRWVSRHRVVPGGDGAPRGRDTSAAVTIPGRGVPGARLASLPVTYWDGVLRRLLLAVPVALLAAVLLFWLDDDLTSTVLVGLVTAACVALVPTPRESPRRT